MEQLRALVLRLAGQVHAQAAEHLLIRGGKDHRGVHLTAAQRAQLVQRGLCLGVAGGADGQRQQHLLGVQAGVLAAQSF